MMKTVNRHSNCIRNLGVFLATVMLMPLLAGCGKEEASPEQQIKVYYVNSSETGIISQDYELIAPITDTDAAIKELIDVLGQMPDRLQYEAPISGDIHLIGYSLNDKLLTMNFSPNYTNLGRTIEILDRAAIVRTFTQLENIDYVSFQIEGTPITDHYGNVIGNMSADTFIYNAGNEINTYEKVELKLYFASEDGKKLIPVYRSVVYNSNISMEKLAVEQVINGPNTDIAFPTVSKETKVRSINSKDGVCYIDFDSAFLSQTGSASAEAVIYSIVNTVTELPNINKVVFSVNGESAFTFMDYLISGSYERNLDLVE
ncbi:MAG: GerMN domain-containing protein [Butyrivibrio sp.]|uniref:GerMN domain-containing protein n=1 Tax=Butyrivibrio sp. TaxID=28121 RepID=UPI0025C07714|nr:GerMN domain-containing protein [Butyrivibrio sp.]MBQ6588923.1 GerMN domain-containing protein [Butyrivibrio sp.]